MGRLNQCVLKYIDGNAEQFTYKGQSLSQKEEFITALFGKTYENREEVPYFYLVTWFWDDYSLLFYFSSGEYNVEDPNARNITVEKITDSDNNMTTDNDVYGYDDGIYGYEDDYYSTEVVDSALIGRWRANDGGTLEIESNGLISSVDFKCWNLRGDNPDSVYCYTDNGRVNCTAYSNHETVYDFTPSDVYDIGEMLNLLSFGSYYYRKDGEPDNGLVGTWICSGLSYWSFKFYEDGTGIYNDKYPITWYTYTTDDGKKVLSYITADTTYFDYYIAGDMLTVYLSDGSRTYTKIA